MSNERRENEIEQESCAPAQKIGRFSWLTTGIFCSTFSIIMLIIVGIYSYKYLIDAHTQLAAITIESKNQLAQLRLDIQAMQTKVAAAEQLAQRHQEDIKQLKQTVNELSQIKQDRQETRALTEAQHYVKLANDTLQFSRNITQAIILLKIADQALGQTNHPKITEIHRAIATDITHLQTAPQIDTTDLYKKLTALNNQLDKIPLLVNQPTQSEQKSTTENQKQTWWQHGLHTSWQALQRIVVVRYHSDGILPPITPEQQNFVYQNLHAMLTQTILALLNKQPVIYQSSLQQAIQWIKQYFVIDSPTARTVLANLTQLEKTDIYPEAPLLTNTLHLFNGA